MDTNYKLTPANEACKYSATFQSVIGNGMIKIIKNQQEKFHALQTIMSTHTVKNDWNFNREAFEKVCTFKLTIDELSCKQHTK